MKNYFILIIATFLSLQLFGQTQKTFVKSFPNPAHSISANMNAPVEFKEWDQPFIRVLTTVSLDNGNTNVLTALAKSGRYQLKAKHSDSSITIYRSAAINPIKYKGKVLSEEIKYIIFVPRHSEINNAEDPREEL